MKRILALTLALALCLGLFAACGSGSAGSSQAESSAAATAEPTTEPTAEPTPQPTPEATPEPTPEPVELGTANIGALKGPTAMGMVKMMAENDSSDDPHYKFTIAAAIDEINPNLVQGNFDIAAVPANVASVLYNNTDGAIQVLAVNTLGVLYIVETGDSIHSVEDLRGKTIYASGKGATPEYALEYMLKQNGMDPETDVTIEWKSEHAECAAALAADENGIAMLPQPFVTVAQTQNENIRIALDMTEEWERISAGSDFSATLITGVVVGRRAFLEENPELTAQFMADYEASVDYVNSDVEGAAALIGQYDIVAEGVAKKALPYCNITFIAGDDMKTALSGYLQTLFDENPQAIGGAMPNDDFYYGANAG